MKRHNHYIPIISNEEYISEIAFSNQIISKNVFWIEFNDYKKSGNYLDNNNYLRTLNNSVLSESTNIGEFDEELYLRNSRNEIKRTEPHTHYYTYIKVIEDKQNQYLEGQIMIFKIDWQILVLIQKFLSPYNKLGRIESINLDVYLKLDKTFKLIINKNVFGGLDYEGSHFTDNQNIIENIKGLNLEINFPVYKSLIQKRKEKLEKLEKIRDELYFRKLCKPILG
jgi:hypothetical protein